MQVSLGECALPTWRWTLSLRAETPVRDPALPLEPGRAVGKAQVWDPHPLRAALGSPHTFRLPLPPLSFCTQRNRLFWFCRSS